MLKPQIPGERIRILADEFLAMPATLYQQLSLGAAFLMFMDTRASVIKKIGMNAFELAQYFFGQYCLEGSSRHSR